MAWLRGQDAIGLGDCLDEGQFIVDPVSGPRLVMELRT